MRAQYGFLAAARGDETIDEAVAEQAPRQPAGVEPLGGFQQAAGQARRSFRRLVGTAARNRRRWAGTALDAVKRAGHGQGDGEIGVGVGARQAEFEARTAPGPRHRAHPAPPQGLQRRGRLLPDGREALPVPRRRALVRFFPRRPGHA